MVSDNAGGGQGGTEKHRDSPTCFRRLADSPVPVFCAKLQFNEYVRKMRRIL
jgi:hypothetical protein